MPSLPVLVGASLGGLSSLIAIGESDEPVARGLVLVDVAPTMEEQGKERIGEFMREHVHRVRVARRGCRCDRGVQPAPATAHRSLGAAEERAPARRRSLVLALGPALHQAARSPDETRSSFVVRPVEGRGAQLEDPDAARARPGERPAERRGCAGVAGAGAARGVRDVAGAGHMVAGDRNDLFNDAIVDFLERLK